MTKKAEPKTTQAKRFKEAKGPQKSVGKSRFSNLVVAKRRQKFYTTGKGSVGVLLRSRRVVKVIRVTRAKQNERLQELTGIEPKGKRSVVFKGFSEVVIGAVDAYANLIMELAAEFAKKRRGGNNRTQGLKLKVEDIMSAREIIKKIAHQ